MSKEVKNGINYGSIQKKHLTIVNMYAFNVRRPGCLKQRLIDLKGNIDSNSITMGDLNIPVFKLKISYTKYQQRKQQSWSILWFRRT